MPRRRNSQYMPWKPPSVHQQALARKHKIETLFDLMTERGEELVAMGKASELFTDPISLYLQSKALKLEADIKTELSIPDSKPSGSVILQPGQQRYPDVTPGSF